MRLSRVTRETPMKLDTMVHTNVLSEQVLNKNEGIGRAVFSPA